MKIPVELRLRKCTRCGHYECTHCRTFCDDLECSCFTRHGGKCTYDTAIDAAGYARFREQMRLLADDPESPVLTWFKNRVGDLTNDDGTVVIETED